MKKLGSFWTIAVLSLLLIAPSGRASEETAIKDTATKVIESFNSTLIDVMKQAKNLKYLGRYTQLEPMLTKTFDFSFMIKYAVGQPWNSLAKDQKQKLINSFTNFTIATYADRFNGYSGEIIKIRNQQDGPRGTKVIKTELIKTDGTAIKLNYLLRKNSKGWQIIDIFLKGSISELATKRSEYTATIKKDGLEGLVRRITEKTATIKKQRAK